MSILAAYYPVFKALHIIAVISWMAGLLYLPRLFAYHASAENGSMQSETFKIMERRLLRGIMTPAMVMTFVFGGLVMASLGIDFGSTWVWIKFVGVGGLVVIHGLLAKWRKVFEADTNQRSPRFYKFVNEIPTILMIIIVFVVVMKPS